MFLFIAVILFVAGFFTEKYEAQVVLFVCAGVALVLGIMGARRGDFRDL